MRLALLIPLLLLPLFGVLWFHPFGFAPEAWRLFLIFMGTIVLVVSQTLSILAASILALSLALLSGTMDPQAAYSGFDEGFILLIVVAFLISRAVVKSGLGKRIALQIIKRFGGSTLGLGYSMVAADLLIAPAFPSNTARSGVLYPILHALCHDSGSKVTDGSRKKMGAYLMMTSMSGLAISSALWLSAMAANPVGAAIAAQQGVQITFASWLLYALLPVGCSFALMPYLLHRIFPPQITQTPQAPLRAQEELRHMGPISRNERITLAVFVTMVALWALSEGLGIDKTAVAFGGLGVLMATRIFTLEDLRHEGEALGTFIWFAILYGISAELNRLGFIGEIGEGISALFSGLPWFWVYLLLVSAYVLIHYLFVSQTAHLLALFGVFLHVGLQAGVPGELLAMMLLFATNFSAVITPQGSSSNLLFAGSGYLEAGEIYRFGGIVTALYTGLFLTVGTAWIWVLM
ncbi:MAG: DASS family sodium-coupled anion symporter [Campylobacterales bacterium]|nr:DASS family sodium-coupled anion symporter [Campylobacterales bacterium]